MKIKNINVFEKNNTSKINLILLIITTVLMFFNIALGSSAVALQKEELIALKDNYATIKLDFSMYEVHSPIMHVIVRVVEDDGLEVDYFIARNLGAYSIEYIKVPKNKKVKIAVGAYRIRPDVYFHAIQLNKTEYWDGLWTEYEGGLDAFDRVLPIDKSEYEYEQREFNPNSHLNYFTESELIINNVDREHYVVSYMYNQMRNYQYTMLPRVGGLHNYYNFNYIDKI